MQAWKHSDTNETNDQMAPGRRNTLLKYAMHTWNILEDYGDHKKLTLQCMKIRSYESKKVLEEWRAIMSNSYHASWWSVEPSREKIFVW